MFAGSLIIHVGQKNLKNVNSLNQNVVIKSNAYDDSGTETLTAGQTYAIYYDPLTIGHRVLMWTQTHSTSQGLDLFVCDEFNFNEYLAGRSATVYYLNVDMHLCTIDFTSPQTKRWYFVWGNRDSLLSKSFDWFLDTNGDDIPSYSGHDWDLNSQSLEPGDWYHVYTTYSVGETIEGYFKSWVNSDSIDFFICDDANYNTWSVGGPATVYELKDNYISASWGTFAIPYADTWHCVYSAKDAPDTVTFSAYMNKGEIDSITVTTPTGSTSWETGSGQFIYWTSTGSISTVKIELYKGASFISTLTSGTSNDGAYYWSLPISLVSGTDYRIKITSTIDSGVYDYSSYFEITEIDSITVTTPSSSTSWEPGSSHYIYWTSTGNISTVKIELYKGASFISTLTSGTSNDGAYYWSLPISLVSGTDYRIKITSTIDSGVYDYSSYFDIVSKSIQVTSPTSSSSWVVGSSGSILWTSTGDISLLKIELYKGGSLHTIISSGTSNDGYFSWTIPSSITPGTDYQIKITSTSDSGVYDYSSYFEIKEKRSIPGFDFAIFIIPLIFLSIIRYLMNTKKRVNI